MLWLLHVLFSLLLHGVEGALLCVSPRRIASIHQEFVSAAQGSKLYESVVEFEAHVQAGGIHSMSPRLAFLRCQDTVLRGNVDDEPQSDECIELLLKERDGHLAAADISRVCEAVAVAVNVCQPRLRLRVVGFVERLSAQSDPPTQFPQLQPVPPPVCVHAISVSGFYDGRQLFTTHSPPASASPQRRGAQGSAIAPRLPSSQGSGAPRRRARAGAPNSDRGAKFAEWLASTFGTDALAAGGGVLDVAGGSGALAFELGVRRGINTTVVDPRRLRLDASQQRTVRYLQARPAARVPSAASALAAQEAAGQQGTIDGSSAPAGLGDDARAALGPTDWGRHFPEEGGSPTAWVVGERGGHGGDRPRRVLVWHLGQCFDAEFVRSQGALAWRDCSVVVGMHPDEATEAIVDMAIQHGKPFAVVPCCVFWRSNQRRMLREVAAAANDDDNEGPTAETMGAFTTVKSWSQFCDYLQAKAPGVIQRAELPMRGRNIVLFAHGSTPRRRAGS